MRHLIKQAFALGLGAAITSKEQVEKVVNDLVIKGELSKAESKEWIDTLTEKGAEAKKELDDVVKSRVNQILDGMNLVSKDEVRELERRVKILEEKLEEKGDQNHF